MGLLAENHKVIASLVAVIVSASAMAGPKGAASIPTAVAPLVMLGRSPAFYAEVDGHQALLELDTGSFELRLSPKFIQDNNLDPHAVHLKIGNTIQETMKPVIEEIAEPDHPNIADAIIPKSDGIVGLDVLRRYAVGIDHQNKSLSFWLGGKLGTQIAEKWTTLAEEKRSGTMATLGLTTRSGEDWYRVVSNVNGTPVNLILDTGTAFSTINPSVAAKLHLETVGQTQVEEIGRSETLSIVQAESLTFGPLRALFPVMNIESEESGDSDGILGTEALGQGKFLIDMPDGKMYARQFSKIHDSNPLELRLRNAGLDFFPDAQNNLVILVSPGSAASKAGVKSGDVLEAFGKVSVAELFGIFSGEGASDSKNVLSIGMELFKKDLTITVRGKDGNKIVVPIPPVGTA